MLFKVYHEEECTYVGNIIAVVPLIASEFICQQFCLSLDDCEFFLYDFDVKKCTVLDSKERKCKAFAGPGNHSC